VELLVVGPAGAAEGPAVAAPHVIGGRRVGENAAAGYGERHGDGSPRTCTASSPSHLQRTASRCVLLSELRTGRGEISAPES
jgi:hypothetical protein